MKKFWHRILKPTGASAKWLVFLTMIAILALGATGYFDTVKAYLDTDPLSLKLGDFRLSLYGALRALLAVALLIWTAAILSDIAEKRIRKLRKLRSSTRSLILKAVQISIYLAAFLMGLNVVGIDLTALTVFSGALGIGLGFGLQKVASNFISGLILLFEKAMEQDDLVELTDGTFGFVRRSSARYTLLETFDGKEIMIPNEDFITGRVTNWTYTNKRGRVEISLGVSYGADIEKARDLILEAASEHPRCMKDPEPKCYLRNFGDSSVDFILHFWLADITEGRWEPQSEVMFAIWRKFKEHGVEIPFPQRDLHLKSPELTQAVFDKLVKEKANG